MDAEARPLWAIANDITKDWKHPYFGAIPYLQAIRSLHSVSNNYGHETGRSVVAYFLANAGTWRGETARRIKAELKAMLKS